jgi:hypothetical protein
MSKCGRGKRLRERHDAELVLADGLQDQNLQIAWRHFANAIELERQKQDHWTWCCECQGLVEVEHPPTGAKEGKC